MKYKIQKLTKVKIDEVATLIAELPLYKKYGLTFEKSSKMLKAALKKTQNDLKIALDSNSEECLGVIWIVKNGAFQRSAYLKLIAVSKKSIGSGIGHLMMNKMEKKYLSPNGMFLFVTKTNKKARSFYEKRAYKKIAEIPNYVQPGITECLYWKKP